VNFLRAVYCGFLFFPFFYLIRFFPPSSLYHPTFGLVPSNTITIVLTTSF